MMKKECFFIEELPSDTHKFIIGLNHENLKLKSTNGSFNVICARLMNLTYANYLRMCRDVLGAEIRGKNQKYPIAVFRKDKNLYQLVKLLNARANLALYENENKEKIEAIQNLKLNEI